MKFLFENWRKYLNEEQEVDEGWGKTLGTAALGLSMLGGAGAKADPGPGAGSFSTDTLSFDVRDVDPPTEEERQESLTAQIKDILLHGGTLRSIAREVMSRKDLKKFPLSWSSLLIKTLSTEPP